ncbi:MAG: hybrid sensor histidine kinase/response regulator [Verrucomicrobia bacterium]|nr:hybrid sensor histidine kinase/response regulator [Verrucomicrobiota bacterium]
MKSEPPDPKPAPPWILVVDDDLMVREMIETVLADSGWTVKLADGAASALKQVAEAPAPPALMICDVLMPKTDGLELTRRMLARVPDLKVVLISGHLEDTAWFPGDFNRLPLLRKPFKNQELLTAVREALPNEDQTR